MARGETRDRPEKAVGAPEADELAPALAAMISELLPVYARLKALGNQNWSKQGVQPGVRYSFLQLLAKEGSLTVPQIARMRGVSRQHIQELANEFSSDGLVEFLDNPKHRRSKLVGLTKKGQAEAVSSRENLEKLCARLSQGMTVGEIQTATRLLADLYVQLGEEMDG